MAILFMGLFFVLVILVLLFIFWFVLCEKTSSNDIIAGVTITIIAVLTLILFISGMVKPACPYTNEQNIERYEALIEEAKYYHNYPNSPDIEVLYDKIENWNNEYKEYQSHIDSWWDGYKYSADTYKNCSEIDFWEIFR